MLLNCRMLVGLGILCWALVGQADVAEAWKKARTLTGIVRDDAPRASVQVKCGKVSRTGVASVSMAVKPFFGKKSSYRAQKVTLPEAGAVVVEWPDGARVEIADGRISGSLPSGDALEAWTPGSALAVGSAFDLETDGLADVLTGLFKQYLPGGLAVQSDARGRWTIAGGAKAGKVVYRRGTQTVDESKLGANPAGLKLTYALKTGLFKGSFKAWQDVKGKIKGVASKVAGIVVDGKGFGVAKIGKLAPVVVRIEGGVQLWANGPYWATTNIGAEKPEDYGYYFWWGDTVGYGLEDRTWRNDYCSVSAWTWVSSKGTRMGSSPFVWSSCPTYGKSNSMLQSQGYIASTGNLVAKYDAATAHLGAPWRMPTSDEIQALVDNCTTTWTTRNGVYGRLMTGKGAYASKSIFLPAAGYGDDSNICNPVSHGFYWSSTPDSGSSDDAWRLGFAPDHNCFYINVGSFSRYCGFAVRPVREFSTLGPAPSAFPAISAFTAAGREPIDGKIDLNLTIAATEWPTNAMTLSFAAVDNVGGTNLTVRTLAYESGAASAITAAGDYHVVWNTAADLGRVSLANVTITATLAESFGGTIATALEATAWTFTNDLSAPWSVDTTEKAVGASAVKSGAISDNGVTSLSTMVSGAGTLGFGWKIDSEYNYDYLHLYVDGSEVFNNKGVDNTWETKSYAISGSGTHTIEWRYTKDGSDSDGCDCGWVDGITWNGSHPLATGEGRRSSRETSVLIDTRLPLPDPGEHAAVQLWENGPYWAECNVGASKPEEYGYYFWWGDTVGYLADTSAAEWCYDSWYGVTWVSSAGERMSWCPFNSTLPTYGKTVDQLKRMGYVDACDNLTAEHDAATQHWGTDWRMPTDDEWLALISNCTTTWTTRNGVYGRLVTGKGAYASKSIFLPAAGYGIDSDLNYPGSDGRYWSSTPRSGSSYYAWYLSFYSGYFYRYDSNRYYGQSVRPLRGFAK